MVLSDFNVHHSSWFSRTGDDRAATRGEALDEATNSSQLVVANQDLHTRLPSEGQPSSPDITLLCGHLLPDATWSTLTTFGSDRLPLQSRPVLAIEEHSFTNFRKADWEGFTAPSPNISITFEGKPHSSKKGDCTSLQRAVHCLFRPTRLGT